VVASLVMEHNETVKVNESSYWIVRSNVLIELYGDWNELLVSRHEEQTDWNTQLPYTSTHTSSGQSQLPNVLPGADPRWLFKSSPAVGYHYFPPGLQSPSQPKNVTVLRPVPSYTAWWQRHIGVNNLPKVVMQLCPGGNWTHELLIASPTPYRYATVAPKK